MFKSRYKKVVNKNPRTNADPTYFAVWVKDEYDNSTPLMLTRKEFVNAMDRAKNNPEDMPSDSIWDWLNNLFNKVDNNSFVKRLDDINN